MIVIAHVMPPSLANALGKSHQPVSLSGERCTRRHYSLLHGAYCTCRGRIRQSLQACTPFPVQPDCQDGSLKTDVLDDTLNGCVHESELPGGQCWLLPCTSWPRQHQSGEAWRHLQNL